VTLNVKELSSGSGSMPLHRTFRVSFDGTLPDNQLNCAAGGVALMRSSYADWIAPRCCEVSAHEKRGDGTSRPCGESVYSTRSRVGVTVPAAAEEPDAQQTPPGERHR
jgi:hypothetical protein